MAQTLNVPIRFRFLKVKTAWEIRTIAGDRNHPPARFAFGKLIPAETLEDGYLTEIDGWQRREDFFKLPKTDEALQDFLTSIGVFASNSGIGGHYSEEFMRHIRAGHPTPLDVTGLWRFRDGLKAGLVDQKRLADRYSPHGPLPKRWLEISDFGAHSDFLLRFDLDKVPAGVVTITDGLQMVLATIFTDVVTGLRFKYCARPDCENLFTVESKHKRKYCCQYCGHLESVRKKRREEKRRRKKQVRK